MLNRLFGFSVGPQRHRSAVRTADMGQLYVSLSHHKWKRECASVLNSLHTLNAFEHVLDELKKKKVKGKQKRVSIHETKMKINI